MFRQQRRHTVKRLLITCFCFFTVFSPLYSQASLTDSTMRGIATQEMGNAGMVAAHSSLPINSEIRIRNPRNGIEIKATVIARIQPSLNRIVDLSREAAAALGIRSGDSVIISTLSLPQAGAQPPGTSAQPREDISIYIAPVIAAAEQAAFLRESFEAEADAGGYKLTRNRREADYTLNLRVQRNMILYDDGAEEEAPPGEKQYRLNIALVRNEDNVDIITFSFLFTEQQEIYAYVPYLFDEAMAVVPYASQEAVNVAAAEVPKEADIAVKEDILPEVFYDDPDSWRNKLLYVRVSADLPLSYYKLKPDGLYDKINIYNGDITSPIRFSRLGDQIVVVPGATIGVEYQFLSWMSAEFVFEFRFGDVMDYVFIPGAGLRLKFPLKPGPFLLAPYAAASFAENLADYSISFPSFAVGAGLQLGMKGFKNGAWFADINGMYSIGEASTKNVINKNFPNPEVLLWNRFVAVLSVGYKFGLLDR